MTRSRDVANIDGLLTAKGDIYAATAAATPDRLGVGANGTVLKANSATATGLEWATPGGGWTLISSVTPSTGAATVSFTSISSSYRDLRVMFSARPSGSGNIQVTTNGATEYSWNLVNYGNTWGGGVRFGYFQLTPTTDLVTDPAKFDLTFYDSNSTTKYKSGMWTGSYRTTALGTTIPLFGTFASDSSSAISTITFTSTGGVWAAGGTVALYGLA